MVILCFSTPYNLNKAKNTRVQNSKKGLITLLFVSFCILFSFLFPSLVFAQSNPFVDSLLQVLPNAKLDSHKVILLNDIGWELKFDDPSAARIYLGSAMNLAQKLDYKKGEGNANNYRGVVEDIHGNSEMAIQYFQVALKIRESLGDKKGVASLYNNIGNVQENLGEYIPALDNYQQSLQLREELGDTARMARLYYNISILHESMGNYPEALDFILQYLETAEITGDETGMANAFNVRGNIKVEQGEFEEAEDYYEKALEIHRNLKNDWETATVLNNLASLKDAKGEKNYDDKKYDDILKWYNESIENHQQALRIREKLDDPDGQSESYNNIGLVHKNLGSYYDKVGLGNQAKEHWDQALDFLNKALHLRESSGDQAGIMEVYNGLGDVYRRQEKFTKALDFTLKYKQIAEEIGDEKFVQNALKDLARIHYELGHHKIAYDFRKEYDELRYKRFNEQQNKSNARKEVLHSDRKIKIRNEAQRQELLLQDAKLNQAAILRNSLIGGAFALVLLALLLFNRNRIKTQANKDLAEKNEIIETEKQKSEKLLLNILPVETAEELKLHGKAKAKQYDSVTVLFTDFKSFTQIAEQTSPEDLVAKLDKCFRAFDDITAKYGIEKIKTIGDSYMCAGGLPTVNDTHASDMLKAAIEMQAFMEKFNAAQVELGKPSFETRIGIHTGPVVAGIVGNLKFAYDIWGDTVNLAARMEASGEPGKINISQNTFTLIQNEFDCTERGKIQAKNKGAVEMYFVDGIKNSNHTVNYNAAKDFILSKLERELSEQLTYHCLSHTYDVLAVTEELCKSEGISPHETILLKTAALYHDSGFTVDWNNHEAEGCEIARAHLPRFGYSDSEIEKICGMIMATRIPQSPKNKLEEIICDADLDYLGRPDFYSIGSTLYEEFKLRNIVKTEEDWNRIQVNFFKAHHFFTSTNLERRAPQKQRYFKEIQKVVKSYS